MVGIALGTVKVAAEDLREVGIDAGKAAAHNLLQGSRVEQRVVNRLVIAVKHIGITLRQRNQRV